MKTLRIFILIALVAYQTTIMLPAFSQCSVCNASAESNINKHENKVGRGLNAGILYLMAIPYSMAGIGFWIWYKHRKKTVV